MLDAHDLIHQAPVESHAWKLQPSIRQSPCQFVNANKKKNCFGHTVFGQTVSIRIPLLN